MFTQNNFKRHAHSLLFGSVVAPLLAAGTAQGQFLINFDENGKGTVTTSAGTVPLSSVNQADPVDPNNGLTPLVYNLSSISGIAGLVPTPGDIDLVEPLNGALVPSDLLRFTPNGLLIVYSDLANESPAPLADVGIPGFRQQNTHNLIQIETGPEAGPNGLFNYTPNPGDPGFLPVPPGNPTYNFLSDPAVPEPASLGLIGLGGIGLLARRRRV